MNTLTTSTAVPTRALKLEAMANISASFELFCLASGMEALGEMMDHDAQAICGPRHARGHFRRAHRWGKTKGKIGFHGGNVEIERPRLRSFAGKEQALPSWEAAVAEDWLGKWAMNQMLINVATRKFARSVRLPAGDVPAPAGAGLSKSAASRRFVALSAARMKEWMASDCVSAWNKGSDSVLMQFRICVALPWGRIRPCSKHFAAPVWYRPGLLWRVRFAIPIQLLSPSDHHKILVFVRRAGLFRAAFIVITGVGSGTFHCQAGWSSS